MYVFPSYPPMHTVVLFTAGQVSSMTCNMEIKFYL